jgi:hypothetical protein
MSKFLNETIGNQVEWTAEWRRQKAAQFPNDRRNLQAAEELERLSREIDRLKDSDIEREISEATDSITNIDDGDAWLSISESVSEGLRSVGFHDSYSTATEFLEWYRDLLTEKLLDLTEKAVPAPNLEDQVENDPAVKAAKRAYDEACAKALAEARKRSS